MSFRMPPEHKICFDREIKRVKQLIDSYDNIFKIIKENEIKNLPELIEHITLKKKEYLLEEKKLKASYIKKFGIVYPV